MDCSIPRFPVLHYLPAFSQTCVIELVISSNDLILCCPLLLLRSIFPNIRVLSNESALCIRWPKYWSFSLSITTSNKYSKLISFRIKVHLRSQDSEPLRRSSPGRLPTPDSPGELQGQGRDIGAQVNLFSKHSGNSFGGRGHGMECILKASVTWD